MQSLRDAIPSHGIPGIETPGCLRLVATRPQAMKQESMYIGHMAGRWIYPGNDDAGGLVIMQSLRDAIPSHGIPGVETPGCLRLVATRPQAMKQVSLNIGHMAGR